ncbi:MAG: MoaD/ThiS family protein [Candidatus Thermoplasmatota archaeon]|nr:MoaD/ThiS family protein [Candidatus Thermoplasmatota archaeon]
MGLITVHILAFGPAAERLDGRHHVREVEVGTTAEGLAIALGLDDWLTMGMALAIGGQRVERDAVLEDGVELALLPPVSGG